MIKEFKNEPFSDEKLNTLFVMAYIGRNNIIDILELYRWKLTNPILVPSISVSKTTLAIALQKTIYEIEN